jgi:hypothetical protein
VPGANRSSVRLAILHRIARAARLGERQQLADKGLGIARGAGEIGAGGKHPRGLAGLAAGAQMPDEVEDIARIALRPGRHGNPGAFGPRTAQQRQAGERHRTVGFGRFIKSARDAASALPCHSSASIRTA